MRTPVTRKKLQDHFSYSWWKYGLLILVAWMGWNILYSVTAYRPPEEKKVILGVYSYASSANAEAYMAEVQRVHMPDMERVAPMYILPDESYGEMILLTRVAANECDIYILPTAQFQSWADKGACQALDEVAPGAVAELEAAGVTLTRGYRTSEGTQEKHLYGIPCRDLPGADHLLGTNADDMYICVFHKTGNDENVLKFLGILVHDLLNEPPATPTDLAQ
ncbi:MAG: hypothetical protein IJE07_08645 [Clostridia bacterium]|nr:hypothetical protein [Clostridia bacterium]